MKQKLLLLGASMVFLGTVAFGGALSFPTFTDEDSTAQVDVIDPNSPELTLGDEVSVIPADASYYDISSINVLDEDSSYDYTLTELEIDDAVGPVVVTGTCGAFDFSLVDGSDDDDLTVSVAIDGETSHDVGSVYLMIPSTGTLADCALSGALVTGTFVVADELP